jgi:Ankyrin repeats (many copies)
MDGHEAVVRLLLKKRAEVNAKADDGSTAPHRGGVAYGHKAVVRLLAAHQGKLCWLISDQDRRHLGHKRIAT